MLDMGFSIIYICRKGSETPLERKEIFVTKSP